MDGDDHESTVIRPRRDPSAVPDADPGGLVEDTRPPLRAGSAEKSRRVHSAHAASAVEQSTTSGVSPYRFSVNGGVPFATDAPTFIGRNPRAPRLAGPVTPRLVRVDSVGHEVSGTHLQVHQEGASVIVSDVRSTNGTVVTMPGAPAVRMLPGESIVAVPGSLIDIGDGNVVEILGIERQVSDGSSWKVSAS